MKRPSPAMLVAMIALVAALGGTAVGAGGHADKAKDTKLFNKLLKQKAPTLTVKRAQTAANADRTDTRGLGCPAGTVESQGECFESASREPVNPYIASQKCAEAGGQLPAALALRAADVVDDVITLDSGSEWSSNISWNPENMTYYVLSPHPGGSLTPLNSNDTRRYRCVFSLVRKPKSG